MKSEGITIIGRGVTSDLSQLIMSELRACIRGSIFIYAEKFNLDLDSIFWSFPNENKGEATEDTPLRIVIEISEGRYEKKDIINLATNVKNNVSKSPFTLYSSKVSVEVKFKQRGLCVS